MPKWLRTHFAGRRHVITYLDELMSLEDCVAGSHVVLIFRHVEILFVGSSRFAFTRVQQLENSGNLFGIGANDVALCHGSDVEYFTVLGRQKERIKSKNLENVGWFKNFKIFYKLATQYILKHS